MVLAQCKLSIKKVAHKLGFPEQITFRKTLILTLEYLDYGI